ncbi:MAG: DUF3829 domain-containing protein, partial [Myxococcales bacterium]|nr:DUF3829 domain-containing protein [Myxococcales bacterium]
MTSPDLRSRRGAALARLVLAVALASVGAGVFSGCTKDTSDQLKGAIEEELKERLKKKKKRATADQTEAQPELLINKLSLYLDCASETQGVVRESHRVYRRRVPAEGSILAGGEAIPTVPEAARGRCQAAVKSGRQLQPPQPELEVAMAEYAEALDAYATRVGEIAAMLAARGGEGAGKKIDPATEATIRELDASVEAAFGAWEDASTSLTREINATQERLDTAVLGRIEGRAGKRVEYFTRAFVIASRPLVRCLSADPGSACEAAFFTLEQAHGELHG